MTEHHPAGRPKSTGATKPSGKEKKRLDRKLDEELEESFPASDPPSASQPTGTEPAGDPHKP